jgi:hypothetical protein
VVGRRGAATAQSIVEVSRRAAIAGGAVVVAVAGCGGGSSSPTTSNPTAPRSAVTIALTSPAFAAGAPIPRVYTCDGRGVSPPLRWSGVPKGTRELVLLIRDPDAPGGSFIHWAVAGIAPGARSIGPGAAPAGAVQGANSSGSDGYTPPCPPHGDRAHHYVIRVIALARPSGLRTGFDASSLPASGLATGTLVGTYARRR